MKNFVYIITIVIFFGLMTGVFGSFSFFGTIPNLIFLAVMLFALEDDSFDPYVAALAGGLLLDAGSALSPGSFTLGFVILVFLIQFTLQQVIFYRFEQRYLFAVVIISYFLLALWIWFFNSVGIHFHWAQSGLSAIALWNKFLPALAYTLLLTYPVYWVLDWLIAITKNRRMA